MSNPLRWFRQNSTLLVVFLGIGAMVIFGLGPVFDVLSRSSSYDEAENNPIVATWKGGDLKRSDLDLLRRRHYDVLRFQQGVQQAAIAQKGEEYQSFVAPIQPIRDAANTPRAQVDDQLMERLLLAAKARDEGFVISDAMIDDFLALLAGEAEFSRADLEQINNEANQRGCSLAQVRRHLKDELLYRQMRVMASSGKPIIPNPTESMELYGKISNRIECEVIPVPVSQFLDEVADIPSNAILRSLYNEGKVNYPDPRREKPGFKIGRKLVAQYFVADYDTFLQNEINKLSDAEVQAEYDRLVEAKDDLVMEVIPEEEDEVTPDLSDESNEEEKPEGQSLNVTQSKAHFVSYRPQDEAGEVADTPAVDTVAAQGEEAAESLKTEPAKEETSTNVETDETATSDSGESTEEKDEADERTSSDTSEEANKSDTNSDESEDSIGPLLTDTPKLKKRAKPLREVVDAVKRQMVADETDKAIQEAITEAQSQVSGYRGAYMSWKIDSKSGKKSEMPIFDYEGIGESLNLIVNETPLVDDEALAKESLGKIMTLINIATRGGQYQPKAVSVANYIFNSFEQLEEFEAQTVQDFQTRSHYVFWLSDKREPRVPSFDECRDEVIAFWKQQQALEMAETEAAKIAEELSGKRDKKLSDVYPERTVKTGEFTWFSNYGRPDISSVVGVARPGDEFMSTAFGLNKFETDVSANANYDTVYVIQRVSDEVPVSEVATDYMENQFFKFQQIPTQVRDTATWYGNQMNLDWNQEFVKEMDLEVVSY